MANPQADLWTIHDLERFPDDEWHRYEDIDGELFVSRPPGNRHQYACAEAVLAVGTWNRESGLWRGADRTKRDLH
jgi:Uma2 family endonuclease